MTDKATAPTDPSQGNSTMAERRAARLAREAEHGLPQRRQLALAAGEDADNDVVITDGINDHGSTQT